MSQTVDPTHDLAKGVAREQSMLSIVNHGIRHLASIPFLEQLSPGEDSHKKTLEDAGVKFGIPLDIAPHLQRVVLPDGWKIVPTANTMWSNLVDDKDRVRAKIFHGSDPGARNAFFCVVARYRIASIDCEDNIGKAYIRDAGNLIHVSVLTKKDGETNYDHREGVRKAAVDWLNEHLPNWEDPSAYWED